MRWFTSDLHLGHNNILKYQENRALLWENVDDMNDGLIANWNFLVDPSDEVWVIGDFIMGHKGVNLALAGLLNGRINLVPGNHDGCWIGNRTYDKWVPIYEDHGITVHPSSVVIHIGDSPVLLNHFPYSVIDHADEDGVRYPWAYPQATGIPLLHGHVHSVWHTSANQFNVGVDVNNLAPVSEGAISAWLNSL